MIIWGLINKELSKTDYRDKKEIPVNENILYNNTLKNVWLKKFNERNEKLLDKENQPIIEENKRRESYNRSVGDERVRNFV